METEVDDYTLLNMACVEYRKKSIVHMLNVCK